MSGSGCFSSPRDLKPVTIQSLLKAERLYVNPWLRIGSAFAWVNRARLSQVVRQRRKESSNPAKV